MHKYEEAVDAALASKDVELAKFYAAKPEDGGLDANLFFGIAVFGFVARGTRQLRALTSFFQMRCCERLYGLRLQCLLSRSTRLSSLPLKS
jgi:hypothetical protein